MTTQDVTADRDGLEELDEMGPIDYIVIEWPGRQPDGSAAPLLLDLVDRGLIRILDIVFIFKDDDGTVSGLDLASVGGDFGEFAGAASGVLDQSEVDEAAAALEPGTSAAVLIWENRWAAPVATALRRSGGQLVASGRIPIQAMLAALDATDATTRSEG